MLSDLFVANVFVKNNDGTVFRKMSPLVADEALLA
jgi:hypothetical protein